MLLFKHLEYEMRRKEFYRCFLNNSILMARAIIYTNQITCLNLSKRDIGITES